MTKRPAAESKVRRAKVSPGAKRAVSAIVPAAVEPIVTAPPDPPRRALEPDDTTPFGFVDTVALVSHGAGKWIRNNIPRCLLFAVGGLLIGWIANVVLIAFVYGGVGATPRGSIATGSHNQLSGALFWAIASSVVSGLISYRWQVGKERFWNDLRGFPRSILTLARVDRAATGQSLLWGFGGAMLVTVAISPALSGAFAVGMLFFVGRFLRPVASAAASSLWRAFVRRVGGGTAKPPSEAAMALMLLGSTVALVGSMAIGNPLAKLGIAALAGTAAFAFSRRTTALVPAPATLALLAVGSAVMLALGHELIALACDGGSDCGGTLQEWLKCGLGPVLGPAALGAIASAGGSVAGGGIGGSGGATRLMDPRTRDALAWQRANPGKPASEYPGWIPERTGWDANAEFWRQVGQNIGETSHQISRATYLALKGALVDSFAEVYKLAFDKSPQYQALRDMIAKDGWFNNMKEGSEEAAKQIDQAFTVWMLQFEDALNKQDADKVQAMLAGLAGNLTANAAMGAFQELAVKGMMIKIGSAANDGNALAQSLQRRIPLPEGVEKVLTVLSTDLERPKIGGGPVGVDGVRAVAREPEPAEFLPTTNAPEAPAPVTPDGTPEAPVLATADGTPNAPASVTPEAPPPKPAPTQGTASSATKAEFTPTRAAPTPEPEAPSANHSHIPTDTALDAKQLEFVGSRLVNDTEPLKAPTVDPVTGDAKPGNVNQVYKAEFENNKVGAYKPASGENNPDAARVYGPLHQNETAYSDLNQALDYGRVPATAPMEGSQGIGSVQELVPGGTPDPVTGYTQAEQQQFAVMDYIAANGDRHPGNMLSFEDGSPAGIDHGNTFPKAGSGTIIRSDFVYEWTGKPLSAEVLKGIDNLDEAKLVETLQSRGLTEDQITEAMARFSEIKEHRMITGLKWQEQGGVLVRNIPEDNTFLPTDTENPLMSYPINLKGQGPSIQPAPDGVLVEPTRVVPVEPTPVEPPPPGTTEGTASSGTTAEVSIPGTGPSAAGDLPPGVHHLPAPEDPSVVRPRAEIYQAVTDAMVDAKPGDEVHMPLTPREAEQFNVDRDVVANLRHVNAKYETYQDFKIGPEYGAEARIPDDVLKSNDVSAKSLTPEEQALYKFDNVRPGDVVSYRPTELPDPSDPSYSKVQFRIQQYDQIEHEAQLLETKGGFRINQDGEVVPFKIVREPISGVDPNSGETVKGYKYYDAETGKPIRIDMDTAGFGQDPSIQPGDPRYLPNDVLQRMIYVQSRGVVAGEGGSPQHWDIRPENYDGGVADEHYITDLAKRQGVIESLQRDGFIRLDKNGPVLIKVKQ